MELSAHLLSLESDLLNQEARSNPARAGELLASEFREFGSSGLVLNRQQVIDGLAHEVFSPFTLTDFHVLPLSDGLALVTYQAHRGNITSLRSSLWILRDGRWQMLFHQGTISSL